MRTMSIGKGKSLGLSTPSPESHQHNHILSSNGSFRKSVLLTPCRQIGLRRRNILTPICTMPLTPKSQNTTCVTPEKRLGSDKPTRLHNDEKSKIRFSANTKIKHATKIMEQNNECSNCFTVTPLPAEHLKPKPIVTCDAHCRGQVRVEVPFYPNNSKTHLDSESQLSVTSGKRASQNVIGACDGLGGMCRHEHPNCCNVQNIEFSVPKKQRKLGSLVLAGDICTDLFPTEEEITNESIENLALSIAEKNKEVGILKQRQHDLASLRQLSARWLVGCQGALRELLKCNNRCRAAITMEQLLQKLGIPPKLVQYSEEEQDFCDI